LAFAYRSRAELSTGTFRRLVRRALGLVAIAALALYLTISVELQMPRLSRALETVKLCIAQIGPFVTEVCAVHP